MNRAADVIRPERTQFRYFAGGDGVFARSRLFFERMIREIFGFTTEADQRQSASEALNVFLDIDIWRQAKEVSGAGDLEQTDRSLE